MDPYYPIDNDMTDAEQFAYTGAVVLYCIVFDVLLVLAFLLYIILS